MFKSRFNWSKPDLRTLAIAATTSFVIAVLASLALFYFLWTRLDGGEVASQPIIRSGSEQSLVVATVRQVNPAVVAITVSKDVPIADRFFGPGLFDDFFGFGLPAPDPSGRTERREIGGGSGFLVSADGHIVTNRHVVAEAAAEYTVFTNDGRRHEATVVATDPVLDVAVIKIAGGDYPYLELGDSDNLEVGQTAIAIGNALGEFRNTVSVGVISGLSRSIVAGDILGRSTEALDEVIQTDAAINRGNSGGPLIDLGGKVIGINVAVAAGSENIGFALPINSVKREIAAVVRGEKITRPFLGIRYLPVTAELQTANHLPVDYGVLIQRGETPEELAIIPGSPAARAGLAENDIILELDGVKLTEDQRLNLLLREKEVGNTVKLKVWRNGAIKEIKVKLEALPETA